MPISGFVEQIVKHDWLGRKVLHGVYSVAFQAGQETAPDAHRADRMRAGWPDADAK